MTGERLAFAAALIAVLTSFGCGKPMYILEIDIERAVLAKPDGDKRMRLRSDRGFRLLESIWAVRRISSLYVHATDGNVEVAILTEPSNSFSSFLFVAFADPGDADVPVEITSAVYEFSGGQPQPLLIEHSDFNHAEAPGFVSRRFPLTLPHELKAHEIYGHGDGLIGSERYRAALENEQYRFVIKLTVDGKPYSVDMTVRYVIGTQPMGGWVGMP